MVFFFCWVGVGKVYRENLKSPEEHRKTTKKNIERTFGLVLVVAWQKDTICG